MQKFGGTTKSIMVFLLCYKMSHVLTNSLIVVYKATCCNYARQILIYQVTENS